MKSKSPNRSSSEKKSAQSATLNQAAPQEEEKMLFESLNESDLSKPIAERRTKRELTEQKTIVPKKSVSSTEFKPPESRPKKS